MRKRCAWFIPILLIPMLLSFALNILLFNQAKRYYSELNEVRLDPLGINGYSDAPSDASDHSFSVLFYGDSRAANWPAPEADSSVVFLNRGIASQTTAQVKLRFQYDVAPIKPQRVILQVGINDLKTIPLFPERKAAIIATCEDNIRQIVLLTKALGATVILTTIFPVGNVPLERIPFWSGDVQIAIDEVNDYIRTLAEEQVIIFDAYSVLADANGLMQSRYREDELHINTAGYDALNQALFLQMKSLPTELSFSSQEQGLPELPSK